MKTLVVGLSILISLVYGQDTPEITEPIKPEYKPAGGTAYLNCTVQHVSGQTNTVTWAYIRPRGNILLSKDDGITLDVNPIVNGGEEKYDILVTNVLGSTNKKVYHLVVRSLVAEDSGTYLCEVRIQGTFNYPSSRGQLFVGAYGQDYLSTSTRMYGSTTSEKSYTTTTTWGWNTTTAYRISCYVCSGGQFSSCADPAGNLWSPIQMMHNCTSCSVRFQSSSHMEDLVYRSCTRECREGSDELFGIKQETKCCSRNTWTPCNSEPMPGSVGKATGVSAMLLVVSFFHLL